MEQHMTKFGYPYSLDQMGVLGLMIANERAAINLFLSCRFYSSYSSELSFSRLAPIQVY